jgi:hypothetical protein
MDVIVGGKYPNPLVCVAVCPSGFVTTTSTTPGRCELVLTFMLAAAVVRTVAGAPPNVTVAPAAKPEPWIVTRVPPRYVPEPGLTKETIGGGAATKVYAFARQTCCPSGFVTHTSTEPGACAPVEPVSVVDVARLTLVAGTPPTAMVAPSWKPVPVSVISAPRLEPETGVIVVSDNDADGV